MKLHQELKAFGTGAVHSVTHGRRLYWGWLAFLFVLVAVGTYGYVHQLRGGLITTAMRDTVSWGFYIGNFTFLVGVAAAAVLLVIPAYVYHWKPIKEVVILGELLAISAIIMCSLFVMVDVGRPDRVWHLMPGIGRLNLPSSLLAWDVLVLNAYLLLNVVIVSYLLFTLSAKRSPKTAFFMPLVLLSIPAAIAIHTVTAFLYNGFAGGPAPPHAIRDQELRHLEGRRADGLRDVPEPLPAARGGLQGVLLGHGAPRAHEVHVHGDR